MKVISVFFVLSIILFGSISSRATLQMSEIVYIGDGQFMFQGFPLEQLVSKEELLKTYEIGNDSLCSAAWRGYQGYWEIQNSKLYLIALIGNPCGGLKRKRTVLEIEKLVINKSLKTGDRYYASWFTGQLVIPISEYRKVEGKKTKSGHTYFEHQVVVYEIHKGTIKTRKIEYRER